MKTPLAVSLACAAASLLALLSASAMTIVPGPGAETERLFAQAFLAVCMFAWLALALWMALRRRAEPGARLSRKARRAVTGLGVIYLVCVLLLAGG